MYEQVGNLIVCRWLFVSILSAEGTTRVGIFSLERM